MDRTSDIKLPASDPRCEPSARCLMRSQCARALAAIPKGAPLGDYSREAGGGTALCPGYLSAAVIRKQSMQAPPRRIHPPIGSN